MTVDSPARTCPRCAAPVTAEAKFCANCGNALEPASVEDAATHARLTAAAPAPLITKMRAARLTGERKPVTALFADVVGSTTLAEQIDPEDWTVIINEAFDLMSRAVFRYEGTIAQLQGDAMVAFFGAPVAHEDDPERAIFAALDMIEAIDEFSRQLRATQGIEFHIRAGVNSGPVMVGNVGSDLRYEYTALGDAMNVASRMQSSAKPGTVVITEMTRRLTGDTFDLDDLGEIQVKGKTEPIHAYQVVGRKADPGRRRGLASVGLDSPMVGRAEPLRRLTDLLEVVRAGRGRVAFVVGEPGIGKSRLVAELKRAATSPADGVTPTSWVEGRCLSYGRNLPWHLVIDLVRSIVGVSFSMDDDDARRALDEGVAGILGTSPEAWDTAGYLAHLLGLPLRPEEEAENILPADVLGIRYVASVHRLLRGLADKGPTVVVLEDIHWADPASIDAARQLIPLAAQLPILVLGVLRAETDAPGWGLIGQSREVLGDAITEIRLDPLSTDESRALVANLLEIESLPDDVRDLIMARAEGNPFFVEEVVRMLIDHGAIVQEGDRWVATGDIGAVEIPESLHGLLLARIDQLPESAKRSLRIAAVIGRQFPVRVLERVVAEA
jgi:class 3 adenylate cyclase